MSGVVAVGLSGAPRPVWNATEWTESLAIWAVLFWARFCFRWMVGSTSSWYSCATHISPVLRIDLRASLTSVLGVGDNLAEKLGEVWQVVAEELGLNDEGLAGVVGKQLASEELRLSL